jgi:hypothetical protein
VSDKNFNVIVWQLIENRYFGGKSMLVRKYFVLFILSCMLSGCVSISIKGKAIESLSVSLFPVSSKNAVTKIQPGKKYEVKIKVKESGSKKIIKHPDYSQIMFDSDDFKIIYQDRWSLIVMAKYPNINHLYEKNYYELFKRLENQVYIFKILVRREK